MLDEETKKVVHAISDEIQKLTLRLDIHEKLFEIHNRECHANKEDLSLILSTVRDIKGTMRFANAMRRGWIWVWGIAAPLILFWQSYKGPGS